MNQEKIYARYLELFNILKGIIAKSQSRLIQEEPDLFFTEHANFLVKSYLISLCTYLEAFLKDLALEYVVEVKDRINKAQLPHNIILWSIDPDVKDKDLGFKKFDLPLTKKEIDDELSGNPFRTAKLFRNIGVNLELDPEFKKNKELVNSVVAKRNSIIHHNDAAMDISLGDIAIYVDIFIGYTKSISSSVKIG